MNKPRIKREMMKPPLKRLPIEIEMNWAAATIDGYRQVFGRLPMRTVPLFDENGLFSGFECTGWWDEPEDQA
jgi:hypothetical protein